MRRVLRRLRHEASQLAARLRRRRAVAAVRKGERLRQARIRLGRPIVHVFGDSHAAIFRTHPMFLVHPVGPATAYKLRDEHSTTGASRIIRHALRALPVGPPHLVLFAFGEIDVRLHINKAARTQGLAIADAVRHTVQAYSEFLEAVRTEFPDVRPLVYNVVPPGEQKNLYGYAHYASREEAFAITREMNHQLAVYCRQQGIVFVDIAHQLVDAAGRRVSKYVQDEVHYNNKVAPLVVAALRQHGLLPN